MVKKISEIFTKNNMCRGTLFVLCVIIISYFLPRSDEFKYQFAQGKPWSYSLLTAPFDIPINLDSVSLKNQKDSVDKNFVNFYKILKDKPENEISELSLRLSTLGATPAQKAHLLSLVRGLYNRGIVDSETYIKIRSGNLPTIKYVQKNVASHISTENMVSAKRAYEILDSTLSNNQLQSYLHKVDVVNYLTENIVVDTTISNNVRNDLYQKAFAPTGVMQKGERIVDKGEIITPQTFILLKTYEQMMKDRNYSSQQSNYPYVGQIIVVLLLMSSMYFFLSLYRWKFFNDMRKMTFLSLMIVCFTLTAFIVSSHFNNALYIVPFAAIPIILSIFFDSRTALFVHISVMFMCSLVVTFPIDFVLLQFIAGVTAINSLKDLSKRSQLIRTALFIFVSYIFTYIALDIVKTGNLNHLNYRMFAYFGVNTILLSFAYIFIFIIEKIFGFISSVTLVELSDINNPILRKLSEECPGTFQHSLQVSNLASDAARKIGANVLLVRTGALYHDIGKINNPAFFTENQHGVNPHELITPEQSAQIVINHVKDGIKIAEKAKLPFVIRDFILQHHGKGKAKYFYTIACNKAGKLLPGDDYTYPGPNPQNKETAILMMADATEAASRSLTDFSDEAIAGVVNKIIDSQIADGLLNECPLSFRDIGEIKMIFVARLKTIYHSRIKYPEMK